MQNRVVPLFFIVGLVALLLPLHWVEAQTAEPPPTPTPPLIPTTAATPTIAITATLAATPTPEIPEFHLVQEGETLVTIAERYGTTADAIQLLNEIDDPELIFIGQQLRIPGATGEEVPAVYVVQMGETLAGVAAKFNTTAEEVAQTNAIVNPHALYAGQQLSIISRTGTADPQPVMGRLHVVAADETLLSVAAQHGVTAAELVEINNLSFPPRLFPGQRVRIPSESQPYFALNDDWVEIRLRPLPPLQGNTISLYVENLQAGQATGSLSAPDGSSFPLTFVPQDEGHIALVGLDAFAPVGRYTLEVGGEGISRPWRPFRQDFVVRDVDYGFQEITITDPTMLPLLAPEVRAEEDAFLATIFNQFSQDRLWEGVFQTPVSQTVVTAAYGAGRSYNGEGVSIFHTGIDYGGIAGTPILAPASGTVVFAEPLTLRGNTIIIDHGWGVMSAFYHLSSMSAAVGERVEAGQTIGGGGNTGLSTGPHLHWDLRVGGTAVNPVQWLESSFP